MTDEMKKEILLRARKILGPPIGAPEGVIPVFSPDDEALLTGQLGFWLNEANLLGRGYWLRYEYYQYSSEEIIEELWENAKEALGL